MENKIAKVVLAISLMGLDLKALSLEDAVSSLSSVNEEFKSLSVEFENRGREQTVANSKRQKDLHLGIGPLVDSDIYGNGSKKNRHFKYGAKGEVSLRIFTVKGDANVEYIKDKKKELYMNLGTTLNDFYYSANDSRVDGADIELKIAYNNLLRKRREFAGRVIDLYLEIKSHEGERLIKEKNLIELNRELQNINIKYDAGMASQLDKRQLEYEVEKLKATLAKLNSLVEIGRERLSNMVGPFTSLDNVEDLPFEGVRVDDTDLKNDILILDKLEKGIKLLKIGKYPSAYLGVNGNNRMGHWEGQGILKLTWRPFDKSTELEIAQALLEEQRTRLENRKREIDYRVREAQSEYDEMARNIEIREQSVSLLRDVVASKREAYHGKIESLMEYMKYLNRLQNEEIDLIRLKNRINGLRKKMLLLSEEF